MSMYLTNYLSPLIIDLRFVICYNDPFTHNEYGVRFGLGD